MDRRTWDSLEVGTVIAVGGMKYTVAHVERYFRSAREMERGEHTVVRVENERHESMMWGHYLLSNSRVLVG